MGKRGQIGRTLPMYTTLATNAATQSHLCSAELFSLSPAAITCTYGTACVLVVLLYGLVCIHSYHHVTVNMILLKSFPFILVAFTNEGC